MLSQFVSVLKLRIWPTFPFWVHMRFLFLLSSPRDTCHWQSKTGQLTPLIYNFRYFEHSHTHQPILNTDTTTHTNTRTHEASATNKALGTLFKVTCIFTVLAGCLENLLSAGSSCPPTVALQRNATLRTHTQRGKAKTELNQRGVRLRGVHTASRPAE